MGVTMGAVTKGGFTVTIKNTLSVHAVNVKLVWNATADT